MQINTRLRTGLLFLFTFIYCEISIIAQEDGISPMEEEVSYLSGNLEFNGFFPIRDSSVGAYGTPQFDRQLYGGEGWMTLQYNRGGWDAGLRFDFFHNSALPNRLDSYTANGIGRWWLSRKLGRFQLSGGYLYDQIGSGIIFRAWEDRPLFIDNALLGARVSYDITPDWKVKVFTGRQKNIFTSYDPIIKGGGIDGYTTIGKSEHPVSLAPGAGICIRTFDDATMNNLINAISSYDPVDSVALHYNTYAYSAYNTLTWKNISWYIEGAIKQHDIYYDPNALRTLPGGTTTPGKFIHKKTGSVIYTSIAYAGEKIGITLEGKRTDGFNYRTTMFADGIKGIMNYLPPMTRLNTYRLTARYSPATQELGEQGGQCDIRYSLNPKWSLNLNGSYITDLDGGKLYHELLGEATWQPNDKRQFIFGLQHQNYNQEVYEVKPGKGSIGTITPYVELLQKFSDKHALRTELSYMHTGVGQHNLDYGDWVFGLAEFTISPHWSFTASDMYNVKPNPEKAEIPNAVDGSKKKLHYPRLDIAYLDGPHRLAVSYSKQVEGIICSGGICRYEPSFSGITFSITSTF